MRLYLLTPPHWDDGHHEQLAMMLRAGGKKGHCIACVQWRLKDAKGDEAERLNHLNRLRELCDAWSVRLIINDSIAGVREDGIHIGQDDGTASTARRCIGTHAILGVSCYGSLRRGLAAQRCGADYVAFGCFFRTPSKNRVMPARLHLLRQWQRCGRIAVVAIGGIGFQHLPTLRRAGADYAAMLSAIWYHPRGCVYAVRQFQRAVPASTRRIRPLKRT